MINLLPPKDRQAIEVAKRNTILRRYLELAILGVLLLALLIVGSFYFLKIQEKNTRKTLDLNNQKLNELIPVQEEAEKLSSSINTISSLINDDAKFSKMLVEIGQLMPANSVLSGLQISSVDKDAPLSITAQVNNEQTAAILRNNLVASDLFEKAEIKTITKIGEESSGAIAPSTGSTAPQTATDAQKKDSPYKFIVVIDAYFKKVKK